MPFDGRPEIDRQQQRPGDCREADPNERESANKRGYPRVLLASPIPIREIEQSKRPAKGQRKTADRERHQRGGERTQQR